MKKILGSILLFFPLACASPVQDADTVAPAVFTPDTLSVTEVSPTGFTATGKVKAADYADMYFRTCELISHVYVKTGQRVKKGDKLADLETFSYNIQLREAEIALKQAELELKDILIGQGHNPDDLQSVPDDIMKLALIKSGYQQAELQNEKALMEIQNASLTAPFDGIVANLTARPHQVSGTSEPFCRIIRNTDMEVEFHLLETELHLISKGKKVTVEPQAAAIGLLSGEICSINPVVDDRGMIKVRARVKGNAGLMEGMNVTVLILD